MTKLKAIIPVAGAGTRLRPFTYTQPKALIPVAGKPIISYIIDDLVNEGIQDFIFIVGYLLLASSTSMPTLTRTANR